MHCSIPIAFFTLFASLLAGPLPQEDWDDFNYPPWSNQVLPDNDFVLSYNDQVLPYDHQLLLNDHQLLLDDDQLLLNDHQLLLDDAGYNWDNDMKLATTDGLEVSDGFADSSMFSIDTDTAGWDEPFLESSCETADEWAYGKLRARDGPVCLKKAPSSQLFRFPNIFQINKPSGEWNTVPQPPLVTVEDGDDDTCTDPHKIHLCCGWASGIDSEASAGGASIAVWDKLIGCYRSMMAVLLHNTISIAKRAQVFPERLAPRQ
jgi:hypothetical protein